MRRVEPREFLDIWERGRSQHPVDRALTLVGAAYPDATRGELAEWCLGDRDAALLTLYHSTFGDELDAVGTCPDCGEPVEVRVSVADLLASRDTDGSPAGRPSPPASAHDGHARAAAGVLPGAPTGEVTVGGRALPFRLPDSRDLAAIVPLSDPGAARAELLRRLVGPEVGELAPDEARALEAALEAADPLTEVSLQIRCPACGRGWLEHLDVADFVWAHVSAGAERLLWQVDRLARAYGWTEDAVLALPPARRLWYVEAVG